MDTKELPQEVVNEISNAIMVHNNPNATKKIVAVVNAHYLKELTAKDTTIKELQERIEDIEKSKFADKPWQFFAKGFLDHLNGIKEVATPELMPLLDELEEKFDYYMECTGASGASKTRLVSENAQKDLKIKEQAEKIEKLTGLLKEQYLRAIQYMEHDEQTNQLFWQSYKEQHGI